MTMELKEAALPAGAVRQLSEDAEHSGCGAPRGASHTDLKGDDPALTVGAQPAEQPEHLGCRSSAPSPISEPVAQQPNSRAFERRVILFASLPSFLIGCTSTAYLPALPSIQNEFSATSLQISATLSGYMAVQATTPMLWGPVSDRVGRRSVLLGAMGWFVVASALCAVAPNVAALIAFRVLQSLGISPTVVCGAGAIADVVPAERRGTAMGVFGLLQLVGPAVGPVVGGAIARAAGWRVIFAWLAGTAGLIGTAVFFGLPETLPARRSRPAPGAPPPEPAAAAGRWGAAGAALRAIGARGARSFVILGEKEVLVLAFVGAASFASIYAFLVTLPALAAARYGLDQLETGALLLPFCLGCTVGSFVGGRVADAARRRALARGGRFLGAPLAVAAGAAALVACLIAMGALLETNIALLALSSGAVGFFHTFTRPGLQSAAIEMHPSESAATAAGLTSVQYAFGAVASLLSIEAARAIGFPAYFTCLAGVVAFAAVLVLLLGLRVIRPKGRLAPGPAPPRPSAVAPAPAPAPRPPAPGAAVLELEAPPGASSASPSPSQASRGTPAPAPVALQPRPETAAGCA